jgi:pilus assembly protein Flp/PilA
MKNLFNRFVREDAGQDLIEYALLATLIAIAGIAGAAAVGTAIAGKWGTIVTALG